MDLSSLAALVGNFFAAAAVVLATVELRRSDRRSEQSRRDLLAARRIDFQLEQLVALAEALGDFGRSAPYQVQLRVRLLPAGLVPSAEQWVKARDPREMPLWQGDFQRDLANAINAGAGGLDWGDWIRDRVRREIDQAVDRLLRGAEPA